MKINSRQGRSDLMTCEIFSKMELGIMTLTANQRLASQLLRQYDQLQINHKRKAWPTPQVLPLQNWLTYVWQKQSPTPKSLLNDFQEFCIWEKNYSRKCRSSIIAN